MRIVGGKHKGRGIPVPKNFPSRPTTDRAKEALFNIIACQVSLENIRVVDLFAGTGSISYEFASRGAHCVVAVEKNRNVAHFIRSHSQQLVLPIEVIPTDVFRFLNGHYSPDKKFDIVFADPPYQLARVEQLPSLVRKSSLLRNDGLFILEHARHLSFLPEQGCFDSRQYGTVHFSFFFWQGA